ELPTLPSVGYELSRVISDPMSSTSDIEKIMAGDQSLTAKVLKLANSAYYAIPGGVSSLQRAVGYIGYDTIHQLVLSASIMNALDSKSSEYFNLHGFWKHAIGVAMAAETTARILHYRTPSDLFTCGLVHDMGKIALHIVDTENFKQTVDFAREKGLSLHEAEDALQVAKHSTVGRLLATKWRLPMAIQACAAHHHQRDMALRGGLSSDLNHVVDIVYLSNLLIHAMKFGHSGHDKVLGVPKEVLDRMQLTPEKLEELIAEIKNSIANADNFLKIIGG
ncbi:MAG TPA: HDOD domain-containing protein, partial [Bdellovibrionales bacterium]|nr:HDOD domain-containing protein [Bdellovibrionales bacterium]